MNPFVSGALSVLKLLASDERVVNCVLELLKELSARSTNKIDDAVVDGVAVLIKEALK